MVQFLLPIRVRPQTGDFVEWLSGFGGYWSGPLCNEVDRAALASLFESAGGARWTNADGWRDDPVPGDFCRRRRPNCQWGDNSVLGNSYGVSVDSLGRVTELDLTRNGLNGRLPPSLSELDEMTTLRVGGNALSGPLPPSLSRLSLVELHYTDTGLCAPMEVSFQNWLNRIASHQGTGVECAPSSDRDLLVALYDATNGANWANAENWLTDAPLGEWHGVHTEAAGRVVGLDLGRNNLTGSIPRELGSLTSLESLWLSGNRLSGSIPHELGALANLVWMRLDRNSLSGPVPPELGNLAISPTRQLETLSLYGNALTGPIPPELGNLANLERLWLSGRSLGSGLTGSIPPELGNLTRLTDLSLYGNALTGSIPPELGDLASLVSLNLRNNRLAGPIPHELGALANLVWMRLDRNSLSGPVPPELGSLASLERLRLDTNSLSGEVPEEFGSLSSLRQLALSNNLGMSGPLPARMTDLRLEMLLAGGTDLCVPSDSVFRTWLETIDQRWIATCTSGSESMAYLTQAVQSLKYPVPLVAGEQALLRVFVTAAHATTAGIPTVRARFYLSGTERHVIDIPAKMKLIPTEVVEHDLSQSANAEIPGEIVQPGLEMVIEIDPDGRLDTSVRVAKRIPETGRTAVDVREMPPFDLTVIPFLRSADPDSAVVEFAEGMATDPEGHELLWDTHTLLPIRELGVTAHKPVLSSSNNAYSLYEETQAIRAMESGRGHYMGMMSRPVTRASGLGQRPGRVSFSIPDASTMAHELGHNLNLQHAPCGLVSQRDPSFPYPDGSTGAWGYDFRDGGQLVHPSTPELMSYCGPPKWISDYHFAKALRFRLFDERPPLVAATSLLLWGGLDAEGEPFLNPAFVVDAPPALPDSAGEHRIAGRTASGDALFALSFAMPEVVDGDGGSSFAFVLPAQPGWASNLATLTLSGPGGSVTLDSDTDLPMTILLDPSTGQVRGILRDLPQADAAALAPQAGFDSLDVLFSRGIPDAAAWSR